MNFRKILLIISVFTFTVSLSHQALSAKSHVQKSAEAKGPQAPVKCYVEYRGGGSDIQLAVGEFSNPNQAKKILQNREVSPNWADKKKKIIFKVKECINESGKFKSSQARRLDDALPR